jgi:hypothetical protein
MSDDAIDIGGLDLTGLAAANVATLGDSVLGHALRRALAASEANRDPGAVEPIAAHDSHV